MEIKRICSYNHMFFKKENRMIHDLRNDSFWHNINLLQEQNQDHQITIEVFLSKRFNSTYYFEDIKIYCDQQNILERSMQIYRDHYHIVPLELYEDSEEINDELKSLLLYD